MCNGHQIPISSLSNKLLLIQVNEPSLSDNCVCMLLHTDFYFCVKNPLQTLNFALISFKSKRQYLASKCWKFKFFLFVQCCNACNQGQINISPYPGPQMKSGLTAFSCHQGHTITVQGPGTGPKFAVKKHQITPSGTIGCRCSHLSVSLF